jgi:hypothetical protein
MISTIANSREIGVDARAVLFERLEASPAPHLPRRLGEGRRRCVMGNTLNSCLRREGVI